MGNVLKYLLIPLIFLVGVALPVEAAMNSELKDAVQSLSTLVSFAVGLVTVGVLLLAGLLGRASLTGAGGTPLWVWLGGVLGVLVVLVSLVAVQKVGAAILIVVTVLGQVLMSLAMDNGGWLGVPKCL